MIAPARRRLWSLFAIAASSSARWSSSRATDRVTIASASSARSSWPAVVVCRRAARARFSSTLITAAGAGTDRRRASRARAAAATEIAIRRSRGGWFFRGPPATAQMASGAHWGSLRPRPWCPPTSRLPGARGRPYTAGTVPDEGADRALHRALTSPLRERRVFLTFPSGIEYATGLGISSQGGRHGEEER